MKTVTLLIAFGDQERGSVEALAGNVQVGLQIGLCKLSFTITPSLGGGGQWPLERGAVIAFAGLADDDVERVRDLALWLRGKEQQQAVALLVREEGFSLV
jgi:hypothetical protein